MHWVFAGYVPRLVKDIEERIKLNLGKPWVPSLLLKGGVRVCETGYLKQSCGDCNPLETVNVQIPQTQLCISEDLKYYYVHHLPDVTRQCSQKQLIPSLLFEDTAFPHSSEYIKGLLNHKSENQPHVEALTEDIPTQPALPNLLETKSELNPLETKMHALVGDTKASKQKYESLQLEYKNLETKLTEVLHNNWKICLFITNSLLFQGKVA